MAHSRSSDAVALKVGRANRKAWNSVAAKGCEWSIPVSPIEIKRAKRGDWNVVLTPRKFVPKNWFPRLKKKKILCLGSGGGQQAPILAAAGAEVISFDISDEQLVRDKWVAEREDLSLETVRGDMADLSVFCDATFDLIFHPASNLFVPDVIPVWLECYRVLRKGGTLMSGFMNPSFFLFDHEESNAAGSLEVRYPLPYSDLSSLSREDALTMRSNRRTVEFGHSLEAQIGGQIDAGFLIAGFYEDYWDDDATLLNVFSPTSMATRAMKRKGAR